MLTASRLHQRRFGQIERQIAEDLVEGSIGDGLVHEGNLNDTVQPEGASGHAQTAPAGQIPAIVRTKDARRFHDTLGQVSSGIPIGQLNGDGIKERQ